jgi:hypothetical protein
MATTNRVAAYFQDVPVIEYDEAVSMEAEGYESGWNDGFDAGFYMWFAAGMFGVAVGFIAGLLF